MNRLFDILLIFSLIAIMFSSAEAEYTPEFWCWDAGYTSVNFCKTQGFDGIGLFGAKKIDENNFEYYFPSPTLDNESWAVEGTDTFTTGIAQAQAAGLKFFANLEDINPYVWPKGASVFTPAILQGMMQDVHDAGADRWFDECFGKYSDFFTVLAGKAKSLGMEYQSGADPNYIWQTIRGHEQSDSDFPTLFSQANPLSMYCYHLDRQTLCNNSLAQNGALGFGFAKTWNKRTSMVYTISENWGIDPAYWRGTFSAVARILALQFRVDDFMMAEVRNEAAMDNFSISDLKADMGSCVAAQAPGRPVLDVVIYLETPQDADEWVGVETQGDAVTWGAFQAGYDVQSSTLPLDNADAYYVVTRGCGWQRETLDLPQAVVDLFSSGKKVFLQCMNTIPSGDDLTANWDTVLSECGVSAAGTAFSYVDMPQNGTFDGKTVRFTGFDTNEAWWRCEKGTKIPKSCITGDIYAATGDIPHVIGRDNCYLVTDISLHAQASYVISRLLSGWSVEPDSDMWGIAGKNICALVACSDTTCKINIPQMADGSTIQVKQYDKFNVLQADESLTYEAPFTRNLAQFDSLVITTTSLTERAPDPVVPLESGTGTQAVPCDCAAGAPGGLLLTGFLLLQAALRRKHRSSGNQTGNHVRTK